MGSFVKLFDRFVVCLRVAAIKLSSTFILGKSAPLNIRIHRAGTLAIGALVVLGLFISPVAIALNHASLSNGNGYYEVAPIESADILATIASIAHQTYFLSSEIAMIESVPFDFDAIDPIFIEALLSRLENADTNTTSVAVTLAYLELALFADFKSALDSYIYYTQNLSAEPARKLIWPAEGVLTSRFGPRNIPYGSENHKGIDIAARYGSPIFAADYGEVIFANLQGPFGLLVKLLHDNGHVTLYAHCSELFVEVGERVRQGQTIARMGMTGRASGVHLHFEVIIDGVNVDPLLHLPSS